jgi:hypothetical protein
MTYTYEELKTIYDDNGCEGLVKHQIDYLEKYKKEKDIVQRMLCLGLSAATIMAWYKMNSLECELKELKARLTGAP